MSDEVLLKNTGSHFVTAFAVLVLLVLLRLIPLFLPDTRLWGISQLLFVPDIFKILYIVIMGVALAMTITRAGESIGHSITDGFNALFYTGHVSLIARTAVVGIMGVLFVVFAAPTHFLGDGYELIQTIGSTARDIVKWSEIGSILIVTGVQSVIGETNTDNARLSFQIVSVFAGVVSIWFYFLIAEIATENPVKRFLIFATLLCSGSLLLFFGYVEIYPLLWPATSGFLYFGLKFINTGRGAWRAGVFLIFGLFIHMQSAVLIPAFIYLILCRGKGLAFYQRKRKALKISALVAIAGLIVVFIYKYTTDLYIEDIFLPLIIGKPIDPEYAVFRLPHILDIINELFLVSPLILLLAIISIKRLRSAFRKENTAFLGLVSVGYVLFLLVIDPKLAMPRDWDLFALSGPALTVLLILSANQRWIDALKRLTVPIVCFLVTAPIPFLYANLNKDQSREYIKYVIDTDFKRSMSSLVVLYGYYGDRGEVQKADSLKDRYSSGYPYKYKLDWAYDMYEKGHIAASKSMLSSLQPNKLDVNYHSLWCQIYFRERKFDKALESINKAIQLKRYIFVNYYNRAMIYWFINEKDKALEDLNTAHRLNANDLNTIQFLASLYFSSDNNDSAIVYAQKLLELDSTWADAHYFLAEFYYSKRQYPRMRHHIEKYLFYGTGDKLFNQRSAEFREMLKKVNGDE